MSEFPKKSEQPAHRQMSSIEIDEQARSLMRDERGLEDWERAASESNLESIKRDWPEWSLEDVQRVLKQVGRLQNRGLSEAVSKKEEASAPNPFFSGKKTVTIPTHLTSRELALIADSENVKSKTLLAGIRSAIKDSKESAPAFPNKKTRSKLLTASELARAEEEEEEREEEADEEETETETAQIEEVVGEIEFTKKFLKEVRKLWGNPFAVAQAAINETVMHENRFGLDHDGQVSNAMNIGILVGMTAHQKTPALFLKRFKEEHADW